MKMLSNSLIDLLFHTGDRIRLKGVGHQPFTIAGVSPCEELCNLRPEKCSGLYIKEIRGGTEIRWHGIYDDFERIE